GRRRGRPARRGAWGGPDARAGDSPRATGVLPPGSDPYIRRAKGKPTGAQPLAARVGARGSWYEELRLARERSKEDAHAGPSAGVERQIRVPRRCGLAPVEHDRVVHRRRATVVQVRSGLRETPERTRQEH